MLSYLDVDPKVAPLRSLTGQRNVKTDRIIWLTYLNDSGVNGLFVLSPEVHQDEEHQKPTDLKEDTSRHPVDPIVTIKKLAKNDYSDEEPVANGENDRTSGNFCKEDHVARHTVRVWRWFLDWGIIDQRCE